MQKVKNGLRYEKNGWIYLSIKGNARERGFAHGSLVANELKEIFKMLDHVFYHDYGFKREVFTEIISELFGPQIRNNYPELYEEMEAITAGANAAGYKTLTVEDIICWNCNYSIDYVYGSFPELIAANPKLSAKYGEMFKSSGAGGHSEGGNGVTDRCSGFIAVGSYTKDGKIVCGHNSFDNFIGGQNDNYIIDIKPEKGNRILMQASAGWVWSGTDYYVTSNGLICTETTIGGFNKFALKDPICCRIRQAMQYGKSLDDCVTYLTTNNSGDYANSWLLGDTKNNTIMRIELGLEFVNVETKKDGFFIGYNATDDPRIRNLECGNTGYDDIRRHQGARRVRLEQLMEQHKGQIDVTIGQEIMADHYDVYLNKINPSSRTCCSHYELDDRAFMSQADRPKPYQPRGAVDGIVCDTTLAKKMSFHARWGSSCGTPFDKTEFCRRNPIWKDQEPYLRDRPSQPWTEFTTTDITNSVNKTKRKVASIIKSRKRQEKLNL